MIMPNLKINIQDITYQDGVTILENVYIHTNSYGIYSINGRNGAGKSTFFKALVGELNSKRRNISLNNSVIPTYSKKIVKIDDNFVGYEFMKVREYIVYITTLFKLRISDTKIQSLLSSLDLIIYEHKLIKELSMGNKQKLAFMSAFLMEGDIFLFDESFENIDTTTMSYIKQKIIELSQNHFIFIISHNKVCFDRFVENVEVEEKKIIYEKS